MLLAKGFDTFHFSTIFGGVTFANYNLAAIFIVSVAMKHRAFVRALLEKEPSIRIEDVLTVSVETAGFLEGLREFINQFGERFEGHVPVTDDDVRIIFDVLSISRRNLALLDRPGAPIAPLIQCSDDHVIRPLAGATSDEVMLFLLNSLQHSFPKEYDRAQRAREGVMQRSVESAIRSVLPTLQFRGNIKLRQAGRVLTDIDLVIVEAPGDRVILAQLKHQDPYGADFATMLARTGRLKSAGDRLAPQGAVMARSRQRGRTSRDLSAAAGFDETRDQLACPYAALRAFAPTRCSRRRCHLHQLESARHGNSSTS